MGANLITDATDMSSTWEGSVFITAAMHATQRKNLHTVYC